MATKMNFEKEKFSKLGENNSTDVAPILVTPKMKAALDGVDRAVPEDPGEYPEIVEPEEEEKQEVDQFDLVIGRVLKSESPAVCAAVQRTACFGRLWYSEEEASYCPELECELRKLCESVYHKAAGDAEPSQVEDLTDTDAKVLSRVIRALERPEDSTEVGLDDFAKVQRHGRQLQTKKKKRPKKRSRRKRPGPPKARVPYLDTGRPVDKFMKVIFQDVGEPPALPESWKYPTASSRVQREIAANWFVEQYGKGLVVNRRASCWTFFYNGMHVCRMWTNAASGALVDCNPWMVAWIQKNHGWEVRKVPVKDKKHTFEFFTGRFRINTVEMAKTVAAALLQTVSDMEVR
jgi:hypothetical protein